ncbi:hypothetical protein DAPPUDRAFT_233875 [Daphnia pulex]|uniref:Uncharacterized protein n=1 Tax=Daphnia pulex TaxID=6669 RepID=E9FVZ9_DAPPU|nr:hypothetical protein DAPPUDRAFT_233875 [Daphnia pulex]|eukprot:EFX89013.1 hypothetical protein DAPPUDRAFT_233875 [Daphnia pulex]
MLGFLVTYAPEETTEKEEEESYTEKCLDKFQVVNAPVDQMIVNDLFVVLLQLATTHRLAFERLKRRRGGKKRIKNDGDDDVGSQKQEEAHFRNGSFRWIAPQ